MSVETIRIFDTTLRDGEQAEGISFSIADKLKIARLLDDFGVDYIEGGWPGSNPKAVRFFKEIQKVELKNSRIAAFGSTRRKGVKPEDDANLKALIDLRVPVCTIFGKSWDLHVIEAIRATLDDFIQGVINKIVESNRGDHFP